MLMCVFACIRAQDMKLHPKSIILYGQSVGTGPTVSSGAPSLTHPLTAPVTPDLRPRRPPAAIHTPAAIYSLVA